jgi:hypothetical protein
MKIVNKRFKETVDYIDKNTELIVKVRDKDMSSIALVGKIGELTYIDLNVEFGDGRMYKCNGAISYQGYDANPTDILGICKRVKTEKELIELIDKSISIANKLSQTIYQLEKDWNE